MAVTEQVADRRVPVVCDEGAQCRRFLREVEDATRIALPRAGRRPPGRAVVGSGTFHRAREIGIDLVHLGLREDVFE